jgi:hypothetical protein
MVWVPLPIIVVSPEPPTASASANITSAGAGWLRQIVSVPLPPETSPWPFSVIVSFPDPTRIIAQLSSVPVSVAEIVSLPLPAVIRIMPLPAVVIVSSPLPAYTWTNAGLSACDPPPSADAAMRSLPLALPTARTPAPGWPWSVNVPATRRAPGLPAVRLPDAALPWATIV